jgi:DNA transformation protein
VSASLEFSDFLGDQLAGFGPVQVRRMFGGAGVFRDGLMFGLISDDTLFLKVDDRNRPDFEAAGMRQFLYEKQDKTVGLGYFECPPEVLDDPDSLAAWAEKAFAAALAGRKPRKAKRAR